MRVDDEFADRVLSELFKDDRRTVAPSFGFDIRPVALHCFAARRDRRIRDIALTVLGGLMFVTSPMPTVLLGLLWWFIGWAVGTLRPTSGGLQKAIERLSWKSVLFAVIVGTIAILAALVWSGLMAVASLIGSAITSSSQSAVSTAPSNSVGGAPAIIVSPLSLLLAALPIVISWPLLYAIVLGYFLFIRMQLVRHLTTTTFDGSHELTVTLTKRVQERLDDLCRDQLANVTVYSGYDPFVGSGPKLPGFAFALPLVPPSPTVIESESEVDIDEKADGEVGIERFAVSELVDHVRQRIEAIGLSTVDGKVSDSDSQSNLVEGLVVTQRVFVSGLTLFEGTMFMPRPARRPRVHLSDDEVGDIASRPHWLARHYLCSYVRSWGGEVMPFTFLHFSTDGEKLYVECARSILYPVRDEYHSVDSMQKDISFSELGSMLVEAATHTVPTVVSTPRRFTSEIFFNLRWNRPAAKPPFDYGARASIREMGSAQGFHNYFQELDADKHFKVVEREALAAIREFLEDHNVDTDEFGRRQTTILNWGAIQTGGVSIVKAQAIGRGAQAVVGTGGGE